MSYVPINVRAYVLAYSGAIGGMSLSGWLADLNEITKIAGAFAEAFDTAWNNPTLLNNLEVEGIALIATKTFTYLTPAPQTDGRFVLPSNWTAAAAACVASVAQSNSYYALQGINPGSAVLINVIQTATIPPIDIYLDPPPAGLYTIDVYLQTIVAAGVSQVQARIDWTDEAGTANFTVTEFLGAIGRAKSSILIRSNGLANIQYRATVIGAIAGASYQLTINVKPT